MTIGPVQLIVLGFDRPDFGAALVAELERLRGNEALRLIDALALHKDLDGGDPSDDQEGWDVLDDIPRDTAAALLLIEHHWAVPLREAIVRAGGFRISDGFISPLDLVEIGLVSAQEAETLHAIETGAT